VTNRAATSSSTDDDSSENSAAQRGLAAVCYLLPLLGRAVQAEPMKHSLKAPGSKFLIVSLF
jgi:hypothetical protein